MLVPELPALGQGGGALRSESLRQYLERKYQVDVVNFKLRPNSRSLIAKAVRNVGRLIRGVPPLFDRFSGYDDQIRQSIPQTRYDLAVIEHFWCSSYAPLLLPFANRLVLDLHNIESELARTHASAAQGFEGWAQQRFAEMYTRLEQRWLPQYDTLLVTSEDDRARLSHPDIRVFPNAIPDIEPLSVPEEAVIAFSGNLEYHPNVEAVRWFAKEIWPRVHEAIPEAEWRLIGRNHQAIAWMVEDLPQTTITGPVEDALEALAAAKICVVPLLSGSGTRFKILEAWAAQRPVVSTTIGAEGLGARDGEHLLIADDANAFVDATVRLWNDADLRKGLGQAGRARYEQHFSWNSAWTTMDASGGL
jgi:glycosyltransferase involved in cell wall biosynthesis